MNPTDMHASEEAAHGFTAHFEPVSIMAEAIQDGICVGWIVDQLIPARHRQLAGHHG